jgi:FkbM family methyltransferase
MIELADIAALGRTELEDRCRSSAQSAYLGGNTSLCRVLGRFKFFVDNTDLGFGVNLMLDGFWEIWLTQFMARYIRPGMHVVDVGANYGYYSVLLGDLVGLEGCVHSIEPNPAAATFLRKSLTLNGMTERTTVHQIAVGAKDGHVTLRVPNGDPKNSHILAAGDDGTWGHSPHHKVASKPLDILLADETAVDFVKIDAEGSEADILTGMEGLIRKFRPSIALEFNTSRYADPSSFFSNLSALYGKIRLIDYDGNLKPLDTSRMLERRVNEDWLLFLSAE